jgi:hypothetical protein
MSSTVSRPAYRLSPVPPHAVHPHSLTQSERTAPGVALDDVSLLRRIAFEAGNPDVDDAVAPPSGMTRRLPG